MRTKTPQTFSNSKFGNLPKSALPLLATSLVIVLAETAGGADFTWSGGGPNNDFSEGNNWSGVAPASANTTALVFDGSTRPAPNVDGAGPFLFNSLTFAATAGAFTVGGNDLQLDGASAAIVQNSSADQVIGGAVRLVNGNASVSGSGSGNLTLAELRNFTTGRVLAVHRNTTLSSLTADGAASLANLTFSSAVNTTLTLGSMTAGSGGYGALNAVGAANGVSNRLNVTSSGNYGFSSMLTDSVTFGGPADVAWSVGTAGWSLNGNATKTVTFVDAGTKRFDSSIYLSNNTTNSRQITMSVSGGDVTLNGRIRDSNSGTGTGANGIIKSGAGNLILSNAAADSDFTGAVNINQGMLIVTADKTLGSSAGSTSVASGATLGFSGGVDYATAEALGVAGTGVGGAGALRNLSGANQFAGAVSLAAATAFGADAGTLTLGGAVTGGQNITKVGAGTVALASASNLLGNVTITAGILESKAQGALGSAAPTIGANGTLRLSTVDQSLTYGNTTFGAATSVVSVEAGRTAVLSNSAAHSSVGFTKMGLGTLELDGSRGFFGGGPSANQTVRVNEGTLEANRTGSQLIAGTSSADATALIIGDGVNAATFRNKAEGNFQISAVSAVTIDVNGTLDTNGVNGSLSNVTMKGGAITTGTGILTLSGAASALTYTGNSTAAISGKLRLLAGNTVGFDIGDGSARSDVTIFATIDNITSPVTLSKTGAGTLELTASSSYTGATAVTAGTLLINNATGSATGASSVTIGSAATLEGTGRISGATTIDGILAPGNSIGKITIANDVTWNGGDAWKFELGAAAASLADAGGGASTQDMLDITAGGSFLKGTGEDWSFDFQNTGAMGWYKLVDWSGASSFNAADFGSPVNLGSGLSGYFAIDNGTSALYLQVIPEPSTWVLVAGGLAGGLLLRGRRRLA